MRRALTLTAQLLKERHADSYQYFLRTRIPWAAKRQDGRVYATCEPVFVENSLGEVTSVRFNDADRDVLNWCAPPTHARPRTRVSRSSAAAPGGYPPAPSPTFTATGASSRS